MITIKLIGNLQQFFEEMSFAVSSVAEAMCAVRANFPGFQQYLIEAAQSGCGYQIFVGQQQLDTWLLTSILPTDCTITICAIPSGSNSNAFRIITGVALLGLGIAGVAFLGITAPTFVLTGISLLLSAFHGRVKSPKDSEREGKKSMMFNGAQSTQQQGGRLQIVYGVVLTGWMVITGKINSTYTPK